MARLHDIVFDAAHPASLARFWAGVLDGYQVAVYDEGELLRLGHFGITTPDDDPTVLVEPISGVGQRLWFQQVPEGKQVKNRVHLDLSANEPTTELQRLLNLGAIVLNDEDNEHVIVLADPEGNEFCLLRR
jgi:catechol 2,3-dioxygenase-like lactoylglutathione lyase family enzyme